MHISEFFQLADSVVNEDRTEVLDTGFLSLLDSPFLYSSTVDSDAFFSTSKSISYAAANL